MRRRIGITGILEHDRRDYAEVESVVCEALSKRPEAILFGGSAGTDAVAFAGARAALQGAPSAPERSE